MNSHNTEGLKFRPLPVAPRPSELRIPDSPSAAEFNTSWGVTMPADLDALPEPPPFRETIPGVAMREVNEPDLFRHFFG